MHERIKKFSIFSFIVAIIIILYAFFIERFYLKVNEYEISASFNYDAILISDLHLGKWKNEDFLEKVVKQINIQIDKNAIKSVFIAGDFTYHLQNIDDLDTLFKPLSLIKVPVYAVLGNHDEERPGPKLADKLKIVLEKNKVFVIEQKLFTLPNTDIKILGLGDNWAGKDDISPFLPKLFTKKSENKNFLILAHNPDTTFYFPKNTQAITLTGHTHGGQIRIPWLYKKIIPTTGDFDSGLLNTEKGQIFTTSGLGEVGLPLRLFIPPEIAVLHFNK